MPELPLQDKRPAAYFVHVATRDLCFRISTAAIERSFSGALKRLFGEQGLHSSDASDAHMVRVLLSPVPEPAQTTPVPARRRRLRWNVFGLGFAFGQGRERGWIGNLGLTYFMFTC